MAHYFTREEAEALLPAISIVLRKIQQSRANIRTLEEQLAATRVQAMSNGHNLLENTINLQKDLALLIQELQIQVNELQEFDCELKDPDTGLIDFLSLRDDQEIYLCWYLGEDRIRFWHYLDAGFAGRRPLEG